MKIRMDCFMHILINKPAFICRNWENQLIYGFHFTAVAKLNIDYGFRYH